MKRRRLLVLWLLIANLLCAQQVALAHMVGHIGQAHRDVAAPALLDEDAGHASFEALSHVCTTCTALAGFDSPLAATAQVFGGSADVLDSLFSNSKSHLPTTRFFQYQSRAPPNLQN